MSEIAKCPRCETHPSRIRFDAGGWGYRCCGAEFCCATYWNQYAAAMELAKAEAWSVEAENDADHIGQDLYDEKIWYTVCKILNNATLQIAVARQRVLEVFK